MMSPMNIKDMVELHNRDLERLSKPRGWQVAAGRRQPRCGLWRSRQEHRSS